VKHRKVPRADSVEHEWCKTCGGLHVGLFDKTGRLFAEAVLDVETVMDMNDSYGPFLIKEETKRSQ